MTNSTSVGLANEQKIQGGKDDEAAMNILLRGELSAVETYEQALLKFEGNDSESATKVLRRIHGEHESAVKTLRDRILALGGKPSDGSGAWGVFTAAITCTAKVLGPHSTISALRQGEEHGVKEYEEAFKKDDLSPECRYLLRTEQNRCKGHIEALDSVVEVLNASGK